LPRPLIGASRYRLGLGAILIALVLSAIAYASIYELFPKLKVNKRTLSYARNWVVPQRDRGDFDFLATNSFFADESVKSLLEHVELARYTTKELVNWNVDPDHYRNFILSPIIDCAPNPGLTLHRTGAGLQWRRPLWQYCYPRMREATSIEEASQTIANTIRERITVVSEKEIEALKDRGIAIPVSIEQIWLKHLADTEGFERVYVAALRSVAIPSRLGSTCKAEVWNGDVWLPAPRPLLMTWTDLLGE